MVSGKTASGNAAQPNVLLICVDDLRPELACYGVDYIHSPNIDALAAAGTLFTQHYVQAPTCGASRCALLTGRYGDAGNDALFRRAARMKSGTEVVASLPAWFREHGYTTVSVGKVSHHPGGRGGANWDDEQQPEMPNSWDRHLLPAGAWQHPRGWMHGLAHGEIRESAESMDVYQSLEGADDIYPDGVSVAEALRQMDLLSHQEKPFFLAVGILRPHLPFGAPAQYMQPYLKVTLPEIPHPGKPSTRTTWHRSGEFMKYNRWGRDPNEDAAFAEAVRKHYAACVSYADAQVGRIMDRLQANQDRQNTIVILWGDHGWHLGEHAVWGKHTLFEESLRSPLIVLAPELTAKGGQVHTVVESIDIYPTLCELADLPIPEQLHGQSLLPTIQGSPPQEPYAVSYFGSAQTLRTATHRLVAHKDGFMELYDHGAGDGETVNLADSQPDLAQKLLQQLQQHLSSDATSP
ncbi:MAG: sulfatase [bacterium]|nr:sulfatase [bacterium]